MSNRFYLLVVAIVVVVIAPVGASVVFNDARWILLFMFLWAMSPFAFVWLENWWDRRP